MNIKTKQKIVDKWIRDNGAASFEFKTRSITLYDGGLWSIEKKKVKRHKIIGYKKLKNGGSEVLFSKKKIVPGEEYMAILWMNELHETILYLQRMERMLNKVGCKTKQEFRKEFIKRIKHEKKNNK